MTQKTRTILLRFFMVGLREQVGQNKIVIKAIQNSTKTRIVLLKKICYQHLLYYKIQPAYIIKSLASHRGRESLQKFVDNSNSLLLGRRWAMMHGGVCKQVTKAFLGTVYDVNYCHLAKSTRKFRSILRQDVLYFDTDGNC